MHLLWLCGLFVTQHVYNRLPLPATERSRLSCGTHSQEDVFLVPEESDKVRLDSFLSTIMPKYSRSYFADLCERGNVHVNNVLKGKNHKLSKGDKITVQIIEKEVSSVAPERIPLDILFEDEHIIAVNKPAGMVVHPAVGSLNGTFVNALLYHLGAAAADILNSSAITQLVSDEEELLEDLPETPEAAKQSPVSLRPGIVHRLDKGTSGVLLAGKTHEAVARLSHLFAQRQVRKVYLSINVGHPGDTTIMEPIGRSVRNRQQMTVYDGPPGKPASTHIRTLCFDGKVSASLVRIETGRTHQIRVHIKHRHTPIIGDETYGVIEWNRKFLRSHGIRRPMLHAYETGFTHPFTGAEIVLTAPIPEDMASLLTKLTRGDSNGGEQEEIFDPVRSRLLCDTTVRGKEPGEAGRGFVPLDRLVIEDEHWTAIELPEEPELLQEDTKEEYNENDVWI